ncbi:hypothetical protein HY837_01480 [archaeon]|nr:hypothetical protein [archaeon]
MFEWSIPVANLAEKKGIKVDFVDGKEVVKSEIISRIEKLDPKFIFLNGHGDDATFYGHENKIAIEISDVGLFDNKVVFTRACNCAKKLGKEAADNHNCKSFIGYENEFVNVRQTNTEILPLRDEVSRPIWEASNVVPEKIIEGSTVAEAIEMSHKKTTREIMRLIFSVELGHIDVLKALIINDDGLIYHGDGAATL